MAMKKIAIIKNGVVQNIAVIGDSSWTPPDGTIAIESDVAQIGWLWDGNTFTDPRIVAAPILPSSRYQGLLNDSNLQDLVTRLQGATVTQIDTWITNNVTTLAQARTVLATIIKVLATITSDRDI